MIVSIDLPDSVVAALGLKPDTADRAVLEAFAVEKYRSGMLSKAEVGSLLGYGSSWEAEDFLARHGAWPSPTAEEIEQDLANLRDLRSL